MLIIYDHHRRRRCRCVSPPTFDILHQVWGILEDMPLIWMPYTVEVAPTCLTRFLTISCGFTGVPSEIRQPNANMTLHPQFLRIYQFRRTKIGRHGWIWPMQINCSTSAGASCTEPSEAQMHKLLLNKKACHLWIRRHVSTRRHVFWSNKKTCLLFRQEDMPSCWTRRHVCVMDKKRCLRVPQEDMSSCQRKHPDEDLRSHKNPHMQLPHTSTLLFVVILPQHRLMYAEIKEGPFEFGLRRFCSRCG